MTRRRTMPPLSTGSGPDRGLRGAAAVTLAVILALASGCDRSPLLVAPGAPAPAFTLARLAGGTAEFPADYRGRVVAIRFWADWCPYCRPEMAGIEAIHGRLRERGLAYLAVNVMQPRAQVERFVREVGVSAEVLLDGEGATTRAYGVMALPVTVLVDREGRVRSRIVGESTAETLAAAVEPLLDNGGEGNAAPPLAPD